MLAWTRALREQFEQSLRWRLYAVLAPVLIACIWAGGEARSALAGNAVEAIEAAAIRQAIAESLTHVLVQDEASKAMILFPDETAARERKAKAATANLALLAALGRRVQRPGLRAMIRNLRSIAEHGLSPADAQLTEAAVAGHYGRAGAIYRLRFLPARQDYEQTARRAASEAERLAVNAQAGMERRNRASLWAVVSSLAIGFGLAGAGMIGLFRRSIARPLGEVTEAIAAIAAGDLARTVPVARPDEIGRAGEAVKALVESMRGSIDEACRSARAVAEQAAALHRIGRTIEASSARAALEASQASQAGQGEARNMTHTSAMLHTLASSITRVTQETVEAAALTRNAVRLTRDTQAAIEQLAESGKVIDSITETMNRVGFETNILALNAAIEAARQGSAGRGFAVVAKQIRSMAEQTQEASAEISRRVDIVHRGIKSAVSGIGAIDESIMQLAGIAAAIAAETKRQGAASATLERNLQEMADASGDIRAHLGEVVNRMERACGDARGSYAGAGAVAVAAEGLLAGLLRFPL